MEINQLAKTTVELGGAFSEARIEYALQMTALGLLAVFSVLALIWGVLAIFKIFLYDIPNRKSKKEAKESAKAVANTVVADPAPATTGNDATVAAIIAAISAYIAEDPQLSEQYANGFRVVSFKRTRNKAFWNSKNN